MTNNFKKAIYLNRTGFWKLLQKQFNHIKYFL